MAQTALNGALMPGRKSLSDPESLPSEPMMFNVLLAVYATGVGGWGAVEVDMAVIGLLRLRLKRSTSDWVRVL